MKRLIFTICMYIVSIHMLFAYPPNSNDWQLIFEDNFTNGFDNNKWFKHIGYHCYSDYELQWTTDETRNVYVYNGELVIKAIRENSPVQVSGTWNCDGEYDYTSGCVISNELFKYGYFEIRCKLPLGEGMWPAFWLYKQGGGPNNEYNSGWWYDEIDIFEAYGKYRELEVNYFYEVWDAGENHWRHEGHGADEYNVSLSSNVTKWHRYGVEWSPGRLQFYCDGEPVLNAYNDSRIANHPLEILMNLSVTDIVSMSESFPKYYKIDYVKVYKKKVVLDNDVLNIGESDSHLGVYSVNIAKNNNYTIKGNGSSGGHLSCEARDYIKIMPGFKSEKGSIFKAKVTPVDGVNTKSTGNSLGIYNYYTSGEEYDYHNKAEKTVNLYPNPTYGAVNIELDGFEDQKITIKIFNVDGKLIESGSTFDSILRFDLSGQPSGLYILKIFHKNGVEIQKFIKK